MDDSDSKQQPAAGEDSQRAASGNTTVNVDSSISDYIQFPVQETAQLPQGAIAFYIPTDNKPIVFRDQLPIFIGRKSPETPNINFDLTPYRGGQLGVSRRHATVEWVNQHYVLTDFNSTNGTFVNDRRLPPGESVTLKRGDYLRLGQLVMLVYVATETAQAQTERDFVFHIYRLIENPVYTGSDEPFLLQADLQQVTHYLEMLTRLQAALFADQAPNPHQANRIKRLTFHPHFVVEVRLRGIESQLEPLVQFVASLQPIARANQTGQPTVNQQTALLGEEASSARATEEAQTNPLYLQLARRIISQIPSTDVERRIDEKKVAQVLHSLLNVGLGLSLTLPKTNP